MPRLVTTSSGSSATSLDASATSPDASARAVSVAICAYTLDRWDDLCAAVASVQTQTSPAAELLVVVDHNDALLARARAAFAGVRVLPSEGPRGLSGARNTAITAAVGDLVAFLDDDAVAEPDWLARTVPHFDDPRVLGVGAHASPRWDAGAPAWFPEEFLWVVGCSYRGLPASAAPVRNLIGAAMCIRRDVLLETGGFDTGLGRTAERPLGCEETELCIRARSLHPGAQFVYDPAARVSHRVPAARGTRRYFRERCRAEGISKAWVTGRVGTSDGLSSERSYVTRVLPAGAWTALRAGLLGDPGGVRRATAIVAGLGWTATGYVTERSRLATTRARASRRVTRASTA